ncbi:MAG TPA: glycosyltransferase family 87 protein [Candidatus Kapabacteria bacterium]|nr:glycosyltransferase family 87 protein [Candidatus Kapabacteria bacterium]
MRIFQYVLLCLLVAFIVWRGIIPAFSHLDTDFPNYYTSARLLLEGKDISRVYDDAWFLQQANQYGMEISRFSPYPPCSVFIMVPFAWAPPLLALQLWTALNIFFLAAVIALLVKITRKDWLWCSLIMLSSGIGLVNNFRFGQFYVVLLLLIIAAYYWWEMRQPYLSGIALGIGVVVKYFPAIYFINLATRKEWKTFLTGIATVVLLTGAGIWVLGAEAHRQFVSNILFSHFDGTIKGQSSFSPIFESWNSLLRRLFVYDPAENPSPLAALPIAYHILKWVIVLTVGIFTVWAYKRTKAVWAEKAVQVQFALVSIAALLLLPASATYHFLLLVLPVALVLSARSPWSVDQKIVLLCYVAIGFMPYSIFRGFESSGVLTVLAYPRLWCMTILFVAAVRMSAISHKKVYDHE